MKKLWSLLFLLLVPFVLFACEFGPTNHIEVPKEEEPVIDNTRIISDSEMKTPYTDKTKLLRSYLGKSFLKDGIGEVELAVATDGDTAQFKEGSTTFTVRFNGVDTPESTYKLEPWGKSASRFTKGKLTNAYKIVLQRDEIKTQVLDSTLKRYLAWVWYQETADSDFRLLNLEIVEQSYSTSKASGTMYADVMMQADLDVQKLKVRIRNNVVKDPDYDYSETGEYLSLQDIREHAQEYGNTAKKVIVRGVVARKNGSYSAYIQQQADGYWYVGGTCLDVKQSEDDPDIPFVGENGNWWVGEVDTEVSANGAVSQSAYEYYCEHNDSPLAELEWMQQLEESEIQEANDYPYVYRPLEWYGIYLYGGFSGQASKLTIGYEVKVSGNFSVYAGSLQITGVTAKGIEVLNREVQEPHMYDILDITELSIENEAKFNTLVELHNLTVTGGYNTKSSDGFTLYCKDEHGHKIDVRVDGNTALHMTKEGEKITVAEATQTTGEKCYYSEGVLIENSDGESDFSVNCFQYFVGKTFESIKGIVGVYDPTSGEGDGSSAHVQIMLSRVNDIKFAE